VDSTLLNLVRHPAPVPHHAADASLCVMSAAAFDASMPLTATHRNTGLICERTICIATRGRGAGIARCSYRPVSRSLGALDQQLSNDLARYRAVTGGKAVFGSVRTAAELLASGHLTVRASVRRRT